MNDRTFAGSKEFDSSLKMNEDASENKLDILRILTNPLFREDRDICKHEITLSCNHNYHVHG
jgi:hypothetical protein